MLQFGSKHVCIEDVHIFKHCHEMTLFLLWIGTCCMSCVVHQTSGVKDLPSLVTYDDSSLAAIRHVRSIASVLRLRPNTRSHSVLFYVETIFFLVTYLFHSFRFELYNETLSTLISAFFLVVEQLHSSFFVVVLDINECSTNSHSCDVNAVCGNTLGSYTCACKPGYSGNGRTCSGKLNSVI